LNQDGPRYLADEYLSVIVKSLQRVCRPADVMPALSTWQRQPNEIPAYRAATFNARRAEVLRRAGEVDRAIDAARIAVLAANGANHYFARCSAVDALVRALLVAGRHDLAAAELRTLSARLVGQSTIEDFRVRVLTGDLEFARLRAETGRPPVDDDVADMEPPDPGGPAPAPMLVTRVRSAYEDARAAAGTLDELLACRCWTDQVDARVRRLDALPGEGD
jgi:hypothetical protein